MLRVDAQSHVFPQAYAELLARNRGALRVTGQKGVYLIDYGGVEQFSLDLERYSPQATLQAMDEAGIDISVVSVNIPGPEWLEPHLAIEGSRLCNDYLSDLSIRFPGRFVGLASLPLGDVGASLRELDRAVTRLGLHGIVMPSHVAGQPVDSAQFEPLYSRLEELGVPLLLHPTVPTWAREVKDYSMIPMLGFMVDTSIAMLRLVLGGIMEGHPRLLVVHPHGGGVLPYIMGRIEEQVEVKGRGREHITRPPSEYYRRVYLDLATPSALAMRYAYDFAGPERLLFASDHPWVSIATMLACVDRLEIPQAHKAHILGLNAASLFKLAA